MNTSPLMPSGLAADPTALGGLKALAGQGQDRAALKEAAKQFESLFMHELLKSMRAATPTSGLMDNEATKLGTEMLDQQFAGKLTGLRGGLSEHIARQLERQMGLSPGDGVPAGTASTGLISTGLNPAGRAQTASPAQSFISRHREAAREAERRTGIPADFMIAQAAHETGWGRQGIRLPDGKPSHNLFGIKAGPDWKGPVAEVTTTEYINGVARKVTARFRAYADAAESFADYARLMVTSPRYRGVVAQARTPEGFAQGLQDAGYATDPQYARKIARVITTTLRLQGGTAQG